MWDTSCPDWKTRLLSGSSLVPDLPLFKAEAEKALRVFKRLRISDVPGQPSVGEASADWIYPIIAALFGSYDVDTAKRMIQEVFLLIPKKNAKTTNAALIMLTAQILNRRPEAESSLIAPAKDIADRQFDRASGAIRLDAELTKLFQVQRHLRLIQNRRTGAKMQVKAADEDIVTGSISTYTLLDETHVLGSKSKAPALFAEIRGALTSRPDGFVMQITTQSKEPPVGQFRDELAVARKVRDGKMHLPLLPVLYELPVEISRDGGWKDKKYWHLVNPNMGKSVDVQYLENELLKAEESGSASLALFASQHFNVEIGLGLSTDNWEAAEFWSQCAEEALDLPDLIRRSEVCTVGIDGGGLDDLLGLVIIGREKGTQKWLVWAHAWCHRKVLAMRKEIAPHLLDFEKDGDLTIVDEVGKDVAEVGDYIEWVDNEGLLPEKEAVGVDPVGVQDIIDELKRRDFDVSAEAGWVVGVPQGYTLTNVIKTTARRVAKRDVIHGGRRMMNWCVANAKTEPKGNAVTITKQRSGVAKIDPVMALFDAATLMLRDPEPKPKSYLADDDLMVL